MNSLVRGEFDSYRVSPDALNKGGVGSIHLTDDPGRVYKEYFDPTKAPRRADVDRLVSIGRDVLLTQGHVPGDTPESSVNWPIDVVSAPDGGVRGVVLPIIPAALHDLDRDVVRTLEFLIMARAQPPAAAARVALLIRMAEILDFVQSRGLVHGDINGKNLAWSAEPDPIMYLIDCDGMVPQSPAPQNGVQAMGWADPRLLDRVIPAHDHLSDRYALALAMYRGLLLTPGRLDTKSNGRWPEPGKIPQDLPGEIGALLRRGLTALDGDRRPTPREWVETLVAAYIPDGGFDTRELTALDRVSAWTPAPARQVVPDAGPTFRTLPPMPVPLGPQPGRQPPPRPAPLPQQPWAPAAPPVQPHFMTGPTGGAGRHALARSGRWYVIGIVAAIAFPYFALIYIGAALFQLRDVPTTFPGLSGTRTTLVAFAVLSFIPIIAALVSVQ